MIRFQKQPKRRAGRMLGFESLERRELMAANLTAGLFSGISTTTTNPTPLSTSAVAVQPSTIRVSGMVIGRTLKVEGTDRVDNIVVRQFGTTLSIDGAKILHNGRLVSSINASLIDKVEVRGYKGGDTIELGSLMINTEVWAGEGFDTVNGGTRADWLHGDSGDDRLSGNGGMDRLWGNGGLDRLWGGDQDDELFGGDDNDFLWGGRHNDKLYGQRGNDQIHGDDGDDQLFGGDGFKDRLWGDADNDWLESGTRGEFADGGAGQDWNAHVWSIDGAQVSDIRQAMTRTCAFLSSLAGASRFTDLDANISYLGDFTYSVRLYDDGIPVSEHVRFDGSMRIALEEQFDPVSVTEGEFWTIVYQRAYLQHYLGIDDSNWILIALFTGESIDRPMQAITGLDTSDFATDAITPEELHATAAARPVAVGDGVHCYMVNGLYQDENGAWFVGLFNPWGVDETHTPELVAEPEADSFTNHDDGFIIVKWEVFTSVFAGGHAESGHHPDSVPLILL